MERGDLQVFKLIDLDVGRFTKKYQTVFSKTRHFSIIIKTAITGDEKNLIKVLAEKFTKKQNKN